MKLALETINLPDLVRAVIDLYDIIAEEKKITIHASLPDEFRIEADRVRLQQALANLIDNAIKYTPPGGRVEVWLGSISRGDLPVLLRAADDLEGTAAEQGRMLSAEQNDQQVAISVKDTGMGISTEDLPRIWDRLYRGDKSRSQKGLGLGLCLVKAVVQAHHGKVEVASQPGNGSLFTIILPRISH